MASRRRPLKWLLWVSEVFSNADSLGRPGNLVHVTSGSEEDSHNPITDDQVVKILAKDGIKLSRRTVAKYRDQMQIPGSRERRAVV